MHYELKIFKQDDLDFAAPNAAPEPITTITYDEDFEPETDAEYGFRRWCSRNHYAPEDLDYTVTVVNPEDPRAAKLSFVFELVHDLKTVGELHDAFARAVNMLDAHSIAALVSTAKGESDDGGLDLLPANYIAEARRVIALEMLDLSHAAADLATV